MTIDVKLVRSAGTLPIVTTAMSWFIVLVVSSCAVIGFCYDDEVTCGTVLKLMNINEGSRLHSHEVKYGSGSGQQSVTAVQASDDEVSCFGNDAQSDTGDNWQVVCDTEEWLETEPVKFKHVDTGVYLALSGQQFGRPIHGQREVVGTDGATSGGKWKAAEGVFMKRNKE
ncbi:hypothetical protein ANCCEY_04471 [Ancylostoma ceylanicum]|uniref:MIR domain-containing protein n=1 Tax=Ancylostoma ceylanicum TaxID=53326 RepID=A0A0D6LYY1_9BILA|nr:hypothetical protein ANCCEY_04471 [Ancylostoma ceylanicum]